MIVMLRSISWKALLGVVVLLAALSLTSWYNYLLFHSLAELFSIAIACGIFFLAWNSRRYHHNDYLLFIGIAYLFVAFFDILHTLVYKGMGVFQGVDHNNLPPQIWLVGRYMEALSLVAAPIFLRHRLKPAFVFAGYVALSTLAVLSLFQWRVFPDCFLPGVGLTFFKIASEYVIITILVGAGWLLVRNRDRFDPDVLRLLLLAILSTIATEVCFTLYVDLYATSNLIGHLFKIVSFWFMYQAIIVTGLTRPHDLMFRELRQEIEERKSSEAALHEAHAFYRKVLDNLPSLIGYWGKDLRNRFGNQAYHDWFGIDPSAMPGMHIKDVIGEELYHHNLPYLEGALAGNPQIFERAIPAPDGKAVRHSLTNYIPDISGGDVQGLFVLVFDITERKRAEEALRESQESFKLLLESTGEGIYGVDNNGNCTFSNPACLRILGYSRPEELLGKNMHWLIHHSHADGSRFAIEECRIFQAFQEGVGVHVDGEVFWRADGSSFSAEYWSYPQRRDGKIVGAVVTFVDITERKKAELEMVKLKRCVENSTASIVVTDKDGVIEYVNPAFTESTGYTFAEAIGQNPRILKSGMHDSEFYSHMWQTLLAGKTWRGEICNRKKSGQLYWEQASISPARDSDGNVRNYIAVKDDISDKKDLERIKGDVERIMRHDLKTPLNGIIGIPQLLEMADNLTEEQLELVRAIKESGNRMLHMIDCSLDLFKMEIGEYVCAFRPVNTLAVIQQLAEHSRSQMSAKNLALQITVDGNQPTPGHAFEFETEERLLYTLFSNLISNAIEASPQDAEIVVELTNTEPKRIAIRNKGAVPRAIREHFFEKYKTLGKRFGTGLGTYSAKLLADTMGYGIDMETSDEDDATCITVSIPAVR